ncbi:MAG TPA: adenylate/guanylate cyclase domain-containing protein [Acetobacteraceae bacterium]
MDVVDWLRALDLGQYEEAFRENLVSMDLLPSLTADDLKELGVNTVGDRRRLLNAISTLRAGTEQNSVRPTPSILDGDWPHTAERRQLSVMFCDISGSTALSTRLDPEDLSAVVRAYQSTVRATIARFGGFIARYVGDGVLIYFGWPEAHETDAESAVRAALAVIAAISQSPVHGEKLSIRVGIATGLVVVGAPIGEGDARQQTAIGETPNLAARLQGLARPNNLVIADSTRIQVGSLFDLEDLGARPLTGFAEPQRAWRVIGESSAASRFEALRSDTTPLIGRDEEFELLLRRWQQAKAGDGRVALISGEPGIGKSRLTAALSEGIRGQSHRRLRWFCSPHHQDSSLYPTIAQLERAAGFARDDSPETKLAKARDLLSPGGPGDDDFELLAELLSLPNAAADLNLSPKLKRERMFEALLRQLSELVKTDAVLAIFEDAHWIDPTSRELLDLMVERVRELPVLLMITFRPEFQPPWAGQPHVTNLALNRLGGGDVAALVYGIAGNRPLGTEVVAEIVERTDGVPLFVEELTKAVLEQGQEGRMATLLSASPVPGLAVPATLHASLVARLDRIGVAAREVAQIGAVLGRDFSYELIEPVAQRPEPDLRAALAQLDDAGLLFCRGVPPQSTYRFKHALVQDAAYGTLLRTRRQELHSQVVTVIELHFADLVEQQPELLAHHLTAAGNSRRATEQWLKAGQRAADRLAHVEAIAHLQRGLALLASLPETAERDAHEIELQLALGLSSLTTKGMGSSEMIEAYGRARQLAERHGSERQLFQALFGLWINNSGSGGIRAARPFMHRLAQVADLAEDDALRLQAHHSGWSTLWSAGEPMAAHAHTEEGRRLYDPEQHCSHRHTYGGHDPGVCARMTGGMTEWLLGYPDKAQASIVEAMGLAARIAHPFSREYAFEYSAVVHLHRGEPERALPLLVTADALRTEQRISSVFEPRLLFGAVAFMRGEVTEAIIHLREALAQAQTKGTLGRPYGHCLLAQALAHRGDYRDAMVALNEAFERIETTGERGWQSELYRVRGLVLMAQGQRDEGQALLEQAVEVAVQQQAKSLELRAAMSLARFWGEGGRRAEARHLLAPVFGWFTEGFDTVDLKQAKALLDELA